jgi:hypothetical protein
MIDLKEIRAIEDYLISKGLNPSDALEVSGRYAKALIARQDAQEAQRRASERRLTDIGLNAVKAALAEEIKRGLV